ncbi:IS3 family transposase [Dactylosporangium sp. CA-233914]|uniref:IS3 family transposase n=1 Tax=Dactylosporangium sp. CA-233914 TaxID=3239934 RepID=UPI003D8B29AB
MDAEKHTLDEYGRSRYTIVKMCRWPQVSPSGFYEWRGRPVSATMRRREFIKSLILSIFSESNETYGHRRVHAALARQGQRCSVELVRALMRHLGLVPCQPRPWRHSLTDASPAAATIPDLVCRDFTAAAPGEKLVGDITYIPTWEGWVYLATVIDCYTKAVIGWAIDNHYRTPLLTAAITMAARNHQLQPGAIFHSDRGSNYTSAEYAQVLRRLDIRQSVGSDAPPASCAAAESAACNPAQRGNQRTPPRATPEARPPGRRKDPSSPTSPVDGEASVNPPGLCRQQQSRPAQPVLLAPQHRHNHGLGIMHVIPISE